MQDAPMQGVEEQSRDCELEDVKWRHVIFSTIQAWIRTITGQNHKYYWPRSDI